MMLDSQELVTLQDDATAHWHDASHPLRLDRANHFGALVLEQHRANFDLWHEEDLARDPIASDHAITEVKHAIDRLNQQRNDLMERIDERLLAEAGEQAPAAPLHSESPGIMIDRLSILALKIFHTAEEADRADACPEHRQKNLNRLAVLREQRDDLAACLGRLWQEVRAGQRRFKLYRQMKMYNDPELNPVLRRGVRQKVAD